MPVKAINMYEVLCAVSITKPGWPGEITLAKPQAKIKDARQKRDQIETLRTQLTALTNELNVQIAELAGITTRARSGFRAIYVPDSTQYEQAGGTRASERKRPAKKRPALTS